MDYDFPHLTSLDDVLPAIEGVQGIAPRKVGDLICVQYAVLDPALFDLRDDPIGGAIRRECRGMLFDAKTGRLLSRPLHKFFNMGEREETRIENIKWDEVSGSYPKMDGSMVRPVVVNDKLVLMTKRGFSDASKSATDHLYDRYSAKTINGIREACEGGLSPDYEWTGSDNQIVVKYGDPKLSLLAVRDTVKGCYLNEAALGIPGPKALDPYAPWFSLPGTVEEKIEHMRALTGEEGAVFRMLNGHMFKVKNTWYTRTHAVISNIDMPQSKRHIAALILEEQIDDVKALTVGRKLDYLLQSEEQFWQVFNRKLDALNELWRRGRDLCGEDRKKLATEYAPSISDARNRSIVLSSREVGDLRERLISVLMRQSQSMNKWGEAEVWLGM